MSRGRPPRPAAHPEPQLGGGANQAGGRAYNERLVLSLIRRRGPVPKAMLARMTGLSPQTVTLIVNRFEDDGLVMRRPPQRGRVGQPSVPYALDPDAAFSFGLKIGRRSVEVALVDFLGQIRGRARKTYGYPTPAAILAFARDAVGTMRKSLSVRARARVVGIGVAIPSQIWDWTDEMAAPARSLDPWRDLNVGEAVERAVRLPAFVTNDATAACGAELSQADDEQAMDFAYLFVGWFIGGGIVLDGSLYRGRTGNAGALGSMPVWSPTGPTQLLRRASLHGLEQRLVASGQDPSPVWEPDASWSELAGALDDWMADAATSIAEAIAGIVSVIDLPSVVIDGALPAAVRDRLITQVCHALSDIDRRGLSAVRIVPGRIGADARLLGASMLPILARFTRDSEVLFKAIEAG